MNVRDVKPLITRSKYLPLLKSAINRAIARIKLTQKLHQTANRKKVTWPFN